MNNIENLLQNNCSKAYEMVSKAEYRYLFILQNMIQQVFQDVKILKE